jgi:hypothetical protein
MRDASLADRLCRGLERFGFATSWAASLPEAIAAIDRDFPCAVACTLRGRTPSLMDLETVSAYLTLGHRFVSLPQVPIWALTPDPSRYAHETEVLGMPVRLMPFDAGLEGLVRDMLGALRPAAPAGSSLPARPACAEPLPVLLVLPNAGEASFLARYLRARHIGVRVAAGLEDAVGWLGRCPFGAIVAEDGGDDPRGRALWTAAEQATPAPPIVLIASGHGWLRRAAPEALPRGIACTLRKPIRAQILEACLRRLLRIPVAAGSVPVRAAS